MSRNRPPKHIRDMYKGNGSVPAPDKGNERGSKLPPKREKDSK